MDIRNLDLTEKQKDLYEKVKRSDDKLYDSLIARDYCFNVDIVKMIIDDLANIEGVVSDYTLLVLRRSLHSRLMEVDSSSWRLLRFLAI